MPIYRPLDVKINLHVTSLASTTVSAPSRKKGEFATTETKTAQANLKNGRLLKETPVPCLGEDTRLHFLGLNKEVPFFLLRAGDDLFRANQEETVAERARKMLKQKTQTPRQAAESVGPGMLKKSPSSSSLSSVESMEDPNELQFPDVAQNVAIRSRDASVTSVETVRRHSSGFGIPAPVPAAVNTNTQLPSRTARRPSGTKASLIPQAIGAVIELNKRSFSRNFDPKPTLQDIKIDSYFNGEHTESTSIAARHSGGETQLALEQLVQVMSGKRVHHLVERPWVIVPPEQNADGSHRHPNHSRAARAPPEMRWSQISQAIMREAEAQGFNEYGDCTPLGSYLASLATMEMPDTVKNMQKPGGPKFGVIDIVVSVGTGSKGAPNTFYLMEPTRSIDERFKPQVSGYDRLLEKFSTTRPVTQVVTADATADKAAKGTRECLQPTEQADVDANGIDEAEEASKEVPQDSKKDESDASVDNKVHNTSETSDILEDNEARRTDEETVEGSNIESTTKLASRNNERVETESPIKTPTIRPITSAVSGRGRSFTLLSEADSDVVLSSPEDGRHRRGYMRIRPTELDNLSYRIRPHRPSMAPPKTPLSALSGTARRRRSDAIHLSDEEPMSKRRRTIGSENGEPAAPVTGFLGVSRRGVIGMKQRTTSSLLGKDRSSPSSGNASQSSPTKAVTMVRRVVITGRDALIVDKALNTPFTLQKRRAVVFNSQLQPLHESVVFGLRDMSQISATFPPAQMVTPMPSSSPIRQPHSLPPPIPWSTSRLRSLPTSSPSVAKRNVEIPTSGQSQPSPTPTSSDNTNVKVTGPKIRRSRSTATPVSASRTTTRNATIPPRDNHGYLESTKSSRGPRNFMAELTEAWKMPEASKDSVLSYAEEGPWMTDTPGVGGVVRHVKSSRPSYFQESEVLFAVRYLIG